MRLHRSTALVMLLSTLLIVMFSACGAQDAAKPAQNNAHTDTVEESAVQPVEESAAKPVKEPAEHQPVEEPDEKRIDENAEKPAEQPAEQPVEEPAAEPAEQAADEQPAAAHVVEIVDFAFSPEKLEIKAGDTVTFVNRDKVGHTATADDKSFDTGQLGRDEEKQITFNEAGEFSYFCSPHPGMKATIVVTE
ncbi:cupredoxin domain-containing protein [Paenibacillus alkalitolerans]|uniref:cupredoxin domain-containing protein n=1 Tax=Paenibacillus alkalitolerans TaxID=2799335 RepID=UPI0018F7CD3B|nr:cupredoxin family copper-binding protein [Paenibacillus alkalitolerans]